MNFKIGTRSVGPDFDPLVVAEIGINHNGDLNEAKLLVDSAAAAGAEIIKHQTHIPDAEMSLEARHVKPGNADISIYEVIDNCSLTLSVMANEGVKPEILTSDILRIFLSI
jgi:N-acetylneuraminate synthase